MPMPTKFLFFLLNFTFLINSCKGDLEELKLLKYSDNNKKVSIEISEKEFNDKDSLISEKKKLKVLDNKQRIINQNNSTFFYYNSKNKLDAVKSIYRRGAKTTVLTDKYFYDKNGKLIFITYQFNDKTDTIQTFKYNAKNQLIEKGNSKFKTRYKYINNRVSEEIEFENDTISKSSKFTYNPNGNKIINDWIFSGYIKMKTYYKYNSKNKLISERDSSVTIFRSEPNSIVETVDEFYYDKNDSIILKKSYDRILSEKDFILRRVTKFEYIKL